VQWFDHVGVGVDDLQLVTALFEDLGFEHGDPMQLEGEWMDPVVGPDGVQAEMMVVNAPDGSGRLELTKYHRSADQARAHQPSANRLGFRHIAHVVEDLDSVVNRLRGQRLNTIGDIVNTQLGPRGEHGAGRPLIMTRARSTTGACFGAVEVRRAIAAAVPATAPDSPGM
jgi:catechol 2,3-dioxygenase-like lactoylglutathione lyase family enzyme